MTKKNISFLLILSFSLFYTQKISIKKDIIENNKQQILKFKKKSFVEYSIYDLKSNEIVNLQFKDGETPVETDDYMILLFPDLKRKIYSRNFEKIASLGSKNMITKLIEWLLEERIINADGSLNDNKIDVFMEKYGCNSCEYSN